MSILNKEQLKDFNKYDKLIKQHIRHIKKTTGKTIYFDDVIYYLLGNQIGLAEDPNNYIKPPKHISMLII